MLLKAYPTTVLRLPISRHISLVYGGDSAIRSAVLRTRRISQGYLPGDAAARACPLHAISLGGVPALPLHGADALHVTLHLPVRQPAFQGASGIVIGLLQQVRLRNFGREQC